MYNNIYRGVVENNNDKEKLGRIQARIFGIHTPDTIELPTELLPWCTQASDLFGIGESGLGLNSVPKNGTHVWIFFENGDHTKPVYFAASKTKTESSPEPEYGFKDPNDEYPRKERLNEPDLGRLCTNTKVDHTLDKEIENQLDKVSGVSGGSSGANVDMEEPKPLGSNVKYTYNNVIETESGHIIELDDTNENERIRIIHKSGTYLELRPDGSIITKSQSGEDNYVIFSGNLNEHIQKSVKTYIENNLDEIVAGYVKQHIGTNYDLSVGSNLTFNAGGKETRTVPNTELNTVTQHNGNYTITGDLVVNGKITATNDITTSTDVISSVCTLNTHVHTGDSGGTTSAPTG